MRLENSDLNDVPEIWRLRLFEDILRRTEWPYQWYIVLLGLRMKKKKMNEITVFACSANAGLECTHAALRADTAAWALSSAGCALHRLLGVARPNVFCTEAAAERAFELATCDHGNEGTVDFWNAFISEANGKTGLAWAASHR